MSNEPNKLAPADHAVGAGLGAVYVAWLLSTARGLGFARDEGFYFNACSHYARWFPSCSRRPSGPSSAGPSTRRGLPTTSTLRS
jgi:hypothetical protein